MVVRACARPTCAGDSAPCARNFRYNPFKTGEMAEWLKAAVC